MIIRQITVNDAERFLNLSKALDQETTFMLLEPDERTTTVEQQQKHIETILDSDNQTMLVAEIDGQLIGFLGVFGMNVRRKKHSVYLVIGILQAYTGQGVGTKLFSELEKWAKEHDITRLELTVMVHNARAIALYKKLGFVIEGTKKHSLIIDGSYIDEYYMAKLL